MKSSSEVFQIKDRDTLKAMIDPLRTQIFETLIAQPLTIKQVAEKLGLSPGNLYYHFNLLEKYGLIRVVETRMVGNLAERLYQSTAAEIDIDPGLISSETPEGQDSIRSTISSTIDATRTTCCAACTPASRSWSRALSRSPAGWCSRVPYATCPKAACRNSSSASRSFSQTSRQPW